MQTLWERRIAKGIARQGGNMNLEQQCVSLELARKLKSLNYPQKGLWFWAVEMSKGKETDKWSICRGEHLLPEHPKCVAPTVSELGEWLPVVWGELLLGNPGYSLIQIYKNMGDDGVIMWEVIYVKEGNEFAKQVQDKKLADALVKMLIWLVENGHLDFKEQ